MIKFDRKWSMPNHKTFLIKPITELLIEEVNSGLWLDPFANECTFKNIVEDKDVNVISNDLNVEYKTEYHLDAVDFFKKFDDNSVDGIVYDPPYSVRQVSECYKKYGYEVTQETTRSDWWTKHKKEIKRVVKKNGKVICFGWNSGGIGKSNGFLLNRVLLVPHGGIHNDTIVTVEFKI